MLAEPPPSLRSVTTSVPPGRRRRPCEPPAAAPVRYWRRLLPVLAVLALITRIPSFRHPLWNPDEGYLAVQARLLASGGTLYATVVDRKPPLLPWLYEAAFALCGDASLAPLRLAAAAAQLLTALALASTAAPPLGRPRGPHRRASSTSWSPWDSTPRTPRPPPSRCSCCPSRRRPYASRTAAGWTRAGLAVAGACLTKQTGGAALAPVLWLLWQHPGTRRTPLLRTAVGASGADRAVACLTGPARFLFWTVTGSAAYASFTGSELHVLARGLTNTALLAAGCAGLLPPIVRVLRSRGPAPADLWLWLAASAGAVLLGFHFFGHYYLQLIPPLVLLATGALQILPAYRLTSALLTSACACALFLLWGLLAPAPGPRPHRAPRRRGRGPHRARRPGPGLGHTPRDVLAGPPRARRAAT